MTATCSVEVTEFSERDVNVVSCSITPTTVEAGETFEITMTVENPYTAVNASLGAFIDGSPKQFGETTIPTNSTVERTVEAVVDSPGEKSITAEIYDVTLQ